ncbi:carbonic anhydrase 1-like isoform X1 [Musca autumnalis]|uniref:carbonic anhydrase 1-like isoform X1 n=1 Tax=Musca autumnalis TaxID=221902 RepID=UPI003CEFBEA7
MFNNILTYCLFYIVALTDLSLGLDKSEECFGKHGIPLDEKSVEMQESVFKSFHIKYANNVPEAISLQNDGDTLIIGFNYTNGIRPTITMGPVEKIGEFNMAYIYLHWLEKSHPKFTLGNLSLPAEIHCVFYNSKYSTLANASTMENGVVILAFPIQTLPFAPPLLDDITKHLPMVKMPGDVVYVSDPSRVNLEYLMAKEVRRFFTYHGTELMGKCIKDIIWFDFVSAVTVQQDFAENVKNMQNSKKIPIMKNFKATEPRKGVVIKGKPYESDVDTYSSIPLVDAMDAAVSIEENQTLLKLMIMVHLISVISIF